RFISALVRPLVWLFIFAAGFRQVLGMSIIPPYQTYILYAEYITPGLIAMIQLFSGMQSSLSMVYDREMGNMRTLLVSPFPRWFLLVSKLLAGVIVSIAQVYVFLGISWFWGVKPPWHGYLLALPAVFLAGLMLGPLLCLPSPADACAALPASIFSHPASLYLPRRPQLPVRPDVFRPLGPLPAVAHPRIQPAALPHLPGKPLHLCGRADSLLLLWAD